MGLEYSNLNISYKVKAWLQPDFLNHNLRLEEEKAKEFYMSYTNTTTLFPLRDTARVPKYLQIFNFIITVAVRVNERKF